MVHLKRSYDSYTKLLLWFEMAPFKSQLIHFLSITARRMKQETFLKAKLVSVEDLPRLVFISVAKTPF